MDQDDLKNKKERFFKHRRNLLILSSIFLFLVLSGGSIEKMSLLGVDIKFYSPKIPVKLVLFALVYMIIKYIQFLFELGGTGIRNEISGIIFNKVPIIAKKMACDKLERDTGLPRDNYQIINGSFMNYVVAERVEGSNVYDTYNVKTRHLWLEFIKAVLEILIKTTWFSEYILPLIIAFSGFYLYFFSSIELINIIVKKTLTN